MKNTEKLQENITTDIALLKKSVQKYSTYSILGWCFSYTIFRANSDSEEILHSPAKQISFLIGILVAMEENEKPKELTEKRWNRILNILNRLFNHYWLLYFPEDQNETTDNWWNTREVALQAFFNYFDSGLLASVEQVRDRIEKYLVPFEAIFEKELGITITKCLEISEHISTSRQEVMDKISELKEKELNFREQLIQKHTTDDSLYFDAIRNDETIDTYNGIATELFDNLNKLGIVDFKELINKYGKDGKTYIKIFSITRGDGPEIRYPTDISIYESKPIIIDKNGQLFCPESNSLFLCINNLGQEIILKSKEKDRYLKSRDKSLESESEEILRKLVHPSAKIFCSVYETSDNQFEHDIIIEDELLTLVIEAKASPPIEPLRDPEKAFIRIRDSFRSKSGIQKAYDQTNSIIKRLRNNESVNLYNKKGEKVYILNPDPKKLQIGICITRDNYGALATDLSLLLEKNADDIYPWAVNILDLKNFQDAWVYLEYNERKFCKFLKERIELHGTVYATDELEYCFLP